VGTAYVQISRDEAIRIGYEIANPKINSFLQQVQQILNAEQSNNELPAATAVSTVLVHCWRGGMRSSKFAQLLNDKGYKTHTLARGYKAYRNFVLESFKKNTKIFILGGETGSGKTEILKKLAERGEQVVDLEGIAHHKGSAFGSLGEKPQPTNEHFENELTAAFGRLNLSKRIWLEDESRNIGKAQIPPPLWDKMKQAPIFRVTVPKSLRIKRLVGDYGSFSSEELKNCILKIQQRLGPQHVKHALEELEKGNMAEVADITLTYYDKAYNYHHETRSVKDIFRIECETADPSLNAEKIIEFVNIKKHA
jgi:tRNA 2-selenouridine synthase